MLVILQFVLAETDYKLVFRRTYILPVLFYAINGVSVTAFLLRSFTKANSVLFRIDDAQNWFLQLFSIKNLERYGRCYIKFSNVLPFSQEKLGSSLQRV